MRAVKSIFFFYDIAFVIQLQSFNEKYIIMFFQYKNVVPFRPLVAIIVWTRSSIVFDVLMIYRIMKIGYMKLNTININQNNEFQKFDH